MSKYEKYKTLDDLKQQYENLKQQLENATTDEQVKSLNEQINSIVSKITEINGQIVAYKIAMNVPSSTQLESKIEYLENL